MRALVIGGSGFIGSHLVDALAREGHFIRVFDRAPARFAELPKEVEFYQSDFGDTASLAEALTGVDIVFHMLSTTVPGTSNLDPVGDIQGNLINTVRLLEIMRSADVKRLIFLSSGGTVYGIPESNPVAEDHPLRPISSYGIVKTAIEKYIHMENHLHGLGYTILRASNPYGPRQGHGGVQGVIGTYLNNVANGDPVRLWGDGSVVRDFIYIDDLVALCLKAGGREVDGIFNAGSGEGHSIRQIVSHIERTTGQEITPEIQPGRGIDVPRIVLDISRTKTAFDWSPTTTLGEGIGKTWEWIRQTRAEVGGDR